MKFRDGVIRLRRQYALVVGGVFCLFVAIGFFGFCYQKEQKAITLDVVTISVDAPSEEKPAPDYKWRGKKIDPKMIRIPDISIEGFVQKVGVDQFGAIAVPNNIHKAGWFVDSTPPGETGLTIIDGHVDGVTEPDGIFSQLSKAKPGVEVEVVLGSDKVLKYRVTSVEEVDVSKAEELLYAKDPKVMSQLNLITCAGKFNENDKNYEKRVIVSAELL